MNDVWKRSESPGASDEFGNVRRVRGSGEPGSGRSGLNDKWDELSCVLSRDAKSYQWNINFSTKYSKEEDRYYELDYKKCYGFLSLCCMSRWTSHYGIIDWPILAISIQNRSSLFHIGLLKWYDFLVIFMVFDEWNLCLNEWWNDFKWPQMTLTI